MAKSTLQSIPVSIGEVINLHIDSMAYDNSAVGRYKDFVVMVDRGAPGDHLKVQITTLRPSYARAKIIEILDSDQIYRIDAPCKLFKICGGCQWQHLPYEKQLEQKDLLLTKFFTKLNLEVDALKDTIPASNVWNYRNKVQYPVRTIAETGRLKAGYFEWHSNDLINIKFCPIQHNLFDKVVETVRELAPKYKITAYERMRDSETLHSGWLRHVCVRIGVNTNEALLTLVAVSENLSCGQDFAQEVMEKHPELVGVCLNINTNTTNVIYGSRTKILRGRDFFFEKVRNIKFKVSATSFFQINTSQAEKLLDVVENYVGVAGQKTILDAYCGVGLISLALAKRAKKIVGIEEIKQSIEDAIYSAKENNIRNVVFVNGKVENKIEEILQKEKPEIVILDPPRSGCNKRILRKISQVNKIIYVSCNPATLSRDLEILTSTNYIVKAIQPIDMFPHSYHVEVVALLEKDSVNLITDG